MGIWKDIKNLIAGMGITGKHLGRRAITIQYPEQKMEMPERSRGVVVLLSDQETGELNCTMCMLCMRACPTGAIQIDAPRDENKKRHLNSFVVDNTICCYCGLCEESCNFSAIKLATKYEFATVNKEDLIWDEKKLQAMGRDVPYEDTRKKKKEAAVEKAKEVAAQPSPSEQPKATPAGDTKAAAPESKTDAAGEDSKKGDS